MTRTIPNLRRYADWRAWLRATVKNSLHNAFGAVLAIGGTNAVEGSAPASLQPYVEGIGLNFEQAGAVFLSTLLISVARSVHEVTKPGLSRPPIEGVD